MDWRGLSPYDGFIWNSWSNTLKFFNLFRTSKIPHIKVPRPCYLMHKFQVQRLQWTSSKAWGTRWSSHPQTSHQQGGGPHHILIISRVSRTPTPPIKWEQRLFQEYHHHIQGLHIIKNISNGSTIYLFHHKSTNTPKEGYKDLTTSL